MTTASVDYDSLPYWEYCRQRELRLPYCPGCERFVYFPRSRCPRCWRDGLAWRELDGTGVIYTYIIDGGPERKVTALVQLTDAPDVRIPAPLVNVAADDVRIAQEVRLTWIDIDGFSLPAFEPAGAVQ